jgi:hypothetical protein
MRSRLKSRIRAWSRPLWCLLAVALVVMLSATAAFASSLKTGAGSTATGSAGRTFSAVRPLKPVTFAQTVNNTDFVQAGISGVGSDNSVSITVSGVSGTVTKALLYYHGIGDPTYSPTGVAFNGVPVVPTNIGDSSTNCWGSGSSTAYRADVTAQVVLAGGNGTYSVDNLANGAGLSANGASLIVFFNDGNSTNNRDVALFEGNDSDVAGFPGDPSGWQATLSGINYTTGTAHASFHVADGQAAGDGDVTFTATPNVGGTNPLTFPDNATTFDGNSLPDNGTGRLGPGQALWDINTFDITGLFNNTPGTYSIDLTHPIASDCLGLIVLALDFEAGALPPPTDTTPPTCSLIATIPGPPKAIQVEVQDTGSGLATIAHSETNAVTVVPPFVSGTTNPLVVTSTKVNQSLASSLQLTVTDVAGNTTVCDPVVPGSHTRAHARPHHRLSLSQYLRRARVRR